MQKAMPYLVILIVVMVGGHLLIDYQEKKQLVETPSNNKAPGLDHTVTEAEQLILDALSASGCEIRTEGVPDEPSLYIISWTFRIKNMPDVITPELSIKNDRGTYTFGWMPAFDTYEKLKRIQSLREGSR